VAVTLLPSDTLQKNVGMLRPASVQNNIARRDLRPTFVHWRRCWENSNYPARFVAPHPGLNVSIS